jgi:hypothetical protein
VRSLRRRHVHDGLCRLHVFPVREWVLSEPDSRHVLRRMPGGPLQPQGEHDRIPACWRCGALDLHRLCPGLRRATGQPVRLRSVPRRPPPGREPRAWVRNMPSRHVRQQRRQRQLHAVCPGTVHAGRRRTVLPAVQARLRAAIGGHDHMHGMWAWLLHLPAREYLHRLAQLRAMSARPVPAARACDNVPRLRAWAVHQRHGPVQLQQMRQLPVSALRAAGWVPSVQ